MTDDLIDEWARSRNAILEGPVGMRHEGRRGQHGDWPISDYRRLLAAVRLRELGVTEVSTIRLRLRFAGHRINDAYAPRDLTTAYLKALRHAQRDVPILPGGRLTARPPLRIRREVQRVVRAFQSGQLIVPPGWMEDESLARLRAYPDLLPICEAVVDAMYRGHVAPVLDRLKEVARLLPQWLLEKPGDIVEATSLTASSLAPAHESNQILGALRRATPGDVLLADEFMRWLPLFLRWVEENIDQIEPRIADQVRRACIVARRELPGMPLLGKVIWHAILTSCYVRYREGLVNWAPGLAFVAKPEAAA